MFWRNFVGLFIRLSICGSMVNLGPALLLYIDSSSSDNHSLVVPQYIIVNWRIKKFLLPHNLYSGPKHIPLFSQRPFHFQCSIDTLFIVARHTQHSIICMIATDNDNSELFLGNLLFSFQY